MSVPTPPLPPTPEPGVPGLRAPKPTVRVVLVGRTGLEQMLRLDRSVELARVREPMHAIGELAEMSAPVDARPATVVVTAGAIAQTDLQAFRDALRSVDEEVRVIGIGPMPRGTDLDGMLPAGADAELVARVVRGGSATVTGAVSGPVSGSVSGSVSGAVAETTAGAAGRENRDARADVGPLEALLSGRDVLSAALAEISRVVGTTCVFTPAGKSGGEAGPGGSGVEVRRGSRVLGTLSASGAPIGGAVLNALGEHAAWLAGWLTLAAQQDQLRRAAFTDELTGAWNRRYFTRYLGASIAHAREARHHVSLMVFDVDNFKSYNDRFGHAAGDEILSEMVRLLGSVIRPTDRVCRIGGDEFAVIFHDPEGPRKPGAAATPGPASVAQIASRFQKQVCEHRFPRLMDEAPGTLTISAGLATFPWDGTTPEALLERADELALQSKRQGKNVITFGPGALRVCDIDRA